MKIADDLTALTTPIEHLSPWPGNPRQGDVGAISESLRLFGQVKPVVVQKSTGHVVAGNHLLAAAAALGWSHVAAVYVDMDDRTAKRFLIADNRTQELGTYDQQGLADLLSELAADQALEGTGYDTEDIDRLLLDLGTGDQPTGRGRAKSTACAFCGEDGVRFQLKLQLTSPTASRGAGSMALCESHWLAHAQPQMKHPVMSFEALRSAPDEEDDALDE